MTEIWRDIQGYEETYQVSNFGNTRSIDRIIPHSGSVGARILKGRILIQSVHTKGYLAVGLSLEGKVKTIRIHRLVAMAFIPNPQMLPEVNHLDENKANNNSKNLEWSSHVDNIRHGTGRSRSAKSRIGKPNHWGEKTGGSKLTEKQVVEIFQTKGLITDLASKFNIGVTTVSNIKNKKVWKRTLINL